MKLVPFTEMNRIISERLTDVEGITGKYFCYYKVFQHAICYEVTETTSQLLRHRFDSPGWMGPLVYAMKRLRPQPAPMKLQSILFHDDGRTALDEEGNRVSFFLSRIIHALGNRPYSIMADHNYPSGLVPDVTSDLLIAYGNTPLDSKEREVYKEVREIYARNKREKWVDPAYLGSSLQVFFEGFHRHYQFLKTSRTKVIFLTNHYHREGLIAAAKLLNVQVIEIQHGLISNEDMYYVYPSEIEANREKGLFPDKILLFGNYWKDILLSGSEFAEDQLLVVGDYSVRASGWKNYVGAEKENILFIGAQKNMPRKYVSYTENLLKKVEENHPEWKVVVKLHPYEKEPELYAHLDEHPQCEIMGKESDLMLLLSKARIQVSVYSTTFFDALGLDIANFSIQNYTNGADYAASMAESGIAIPVQFEDDPISIWKTLPSKPNLEREEVYASFNPKRIYALLESVD